MTTKCGMRNAECGNTGGTRTYGFERTLRLLFRTSHSAFRIAFFLLLCSPAFAAPWNAGEAIKSFIRANYPWQAVELRDLRLSAAPPAERPASITVEKTPPGRSLFRLHFRNSRSITAEATVTAFDRVVMARGANRKGRVLREDDVYETVMESGRIPKGALRSAATAIGRELVRSTMPDRPIIDAMVAPGPLVKRGRRVEICVEAPGFTIRTAGEIRQNAAVGDYVQALNIASKKIVTGLLIDENTVRVEL